MTTARTLTAAIKPQPLRPGAAVGLISPASRPGSPAVLEKARRVVAEMGFEPRLGEHAFSMHGYTAGTDEERLADVNSFIRDPSVRAIMCITGGFGSLRLIDSIDYDSLRDDPKIVLGSDDATCLLLAVNKHTGLVVFHGCNLDRVDSRASLDELKGALTSTRPLAPLGTDDFLSDFCYTSFGGTASGRLVGGNLTALTSMMGTRHEVDCTGAIVFLEERDERLDILDRWFTNLYLSGSLETASACIVGRLHNCNSAGLRSMLSVEELFGERLAQLQLPSCFGLPIGQQADCRIVPIGIEAELDADRGRLELKEAALAE